MAGEAEGRGDVLTATGRLMQCPVPLKLIICSSQPARPQDNQPDVTVEAVRGTEEGAGLIISALHGRMTDLLVAAGGAPVLLPLSHGGFSVGKSKAPPWLWCRPRTVTCRGLPCKPPYPSNGFFLAAFLQAPQSSGPHVTPQHLPEGQGGIQRGYPELVLSD